MAGLTQVQKNQVLEAIRQEGLEPSTFESRVLGGGLSPLIFVVSHARRAETNLSICRYSNYFEIQWAPEHEGTQTSSRAQDWASVLKLVHRWAVMAAQELAAPDLWKIVQNERTLLTGRGDESNLPFTSDERERLRQRLHETGRFLAESNGLDEAATVRVEAKIDYLIGATERLGRFDWKEVFVATILGIAIELGLKAPAIQAAFQFAAAQVLPVLGLAGQLLTRP